MDSRRDNTRIIKAPQARDQREILAHRSPPPHADEQSRSRCGRAAGGACRLRRHRPRRTQLDAFDRIVAGLRSLEDDETLLVPVRQARRHLPTHKDAPRVLIANSNLVPHWGTWTTSTSWIGRAS